jgi:hypothetical protein
MQMNEIKASFNGGFYIPGKGFSAPAVKKPFFLLQ